MYVGKSKCIYITLQNRLEENRHSGSVNHYVGGLIFRILRARMLPFWQVFLRKPIYRKHRRLCE